MSAAVWVERPWPRRSWATTRYPSEKEHQLRVPVIGGKGPAVSEHEGLTTPPILVEEFRAVSAVTVPMLCPFLCSPSPSPAFFLDCHGAISCACTLLVSACTAPRGASPHGRPEEAPTLSRLSRAATTD